MSAQLLDGKTLSLSLCETMKQRINSLRKQGYPAPGLAVILIGEDPASQVYVRNKRKTCAHIGIQSYNYDLPNTTSQATLHKLIETLNKDPDVNGILVQLPLPTHLNSHALLEAIHPSKDVDGFHPYNLGCLAQKYPRLRPCTPAGIMRLLEWAKIDLKGLHAVVIGASNIVGLPMGLELLASGCTVTTCHRLTHDLASHIRQADLIVSATGKTHLISGDWVKPGAIVIDVGIHRLPDDRIVGDIDFDSVAPKASWITPVPGGVGPMTVALLMENTLKAYGQFHEVTHEAY